MVTIYTNEKWEQIIACLFGKAICFFLFFHFGVFLSQDISLKEISDSKNENQNYQYQAIDSCHSSIHTLGGAIIIDNTKNIETHSTLVKIKKASRTSDFLNRKQPIKKIIAKKNYPSNPLFCQSVINKLNLFVENSFLNYYIAYLNNNNTPKSKSILLTTILPLFFIFLLILLKNNYINLFSRNILLNFNHFSRPPPFRYT